MTFGEKVRLLRTQNNLTQSQAAELSGLSLRTIINYEKHNKTPQRKETYDALATLFGVDISYLMQDDINDYITVSKSKLNKNETNKANFLLAEIKAMFLDKSMSETDKERFMIAVQEQYWKHKSKTKKTKS